MKRVMIMVLMSTAVVGALAIGTEAQRRGRGQQQGAPQSDAIAPALGELQWGMNAKQVFNHFKSQIQERYQERISKARDAMTEDRLRHDMSQEIQRIRRSYTRFDGETTGWDVSFLRDEFTHGNSESMLVVRDGNSQNFFFFINNRLWKWYKAFDSSVFAGQSFQQFTQALQGRFGRALSREGRLREGGAEKRWLEWQDANTRLRAVDENRFYGFYCLVFEDKSTLQNLENLRTNTIRRGDNRHSLVDSVTGDDAQEASSGNQDIVDRITGRIRRRTQAEEGMDADRGSSRMREPSRMRTELDDDPLEGMDF